MVQVIKRIIRHQRLLLAAVLLVLLVLGYRWATSGSFRLVGTYDGETGTLCFLPTTGSSPDGFIYATGSGMGDIVHRRWDGTEVWRIAVPPVLEPDGALISWPWQEIAYSANLHTVAILTIEKRTFFLDSWQDGKPVAHIQLPPTIEGTPIRTYEFAGLAALNDGRLLLACRTGSAFLLLTLDGEQITTSGPFALPKPWTGWHCALSPDGTVFTATRFSGDPMDTCYFTITPRGKGQHARFMHAFPAMGYFPTFYPQGIVSSGHTLYNAKGQIPLPFNSSINSIALPGADARATGNHCVVVFHTNNGRNAQFSVFIPGTGATWDIPFDCDYFNWHATPDNRYTALRGKFATSPINSYVITHYARKWPFLNRLKHESIIIIDRSGGVCAEMPLSTTRSDTKMMDDRSFYLSPDGHMIALRKQQKNGNDVMLLYRW